MTKIDEFEDLQIADENVIFGDVETKPSTRSGLTSIYDTLRSELSKPVDVAPTFVFKPRGRAVSVRFKTNLPLEMLQRWQRNSAKKRGGNSDSLLLATFVVAGQTQCLVVDGEDVTDDGGDYLTFRHRDVIESLGALDYQGAVKNFFANDAEILRASGEILDKCGYGEVDEDEFEDDTDPLA